MQDSPAGDWTADGAAPIRSTHSSTTVNATRTARLMISPPKNRDIALDLQLPDLAVQIVDHLLRIFDRRALAAAWKTHAI
jgi:hypothetical protein